VNAVKAQLLKLCREYVSQRIRTTQDAIASAQAAANDETKSSSGDKYETTRAMMQLEIEKNAVQLSEALKLKQALDHIKIDNQSAAVMPGSVVITNQGNYFIAISAGKLEVDGKVFFTIAPSSPIGLRLQGLKAGETTNFNGRDFQIHEIW
jgi:transcription elongation GreA/GreB family factor